jgi:hypothetical protein
LPVRSICSPQLIPLDLELCLYLAKL